MAAMTVTLSPEQALQLEQLIAEGCFSSLEDAVAHSIDLLTREAHLGLRLSPSARTRVQEGIEAAGRGDLVAQQEVEAFFEEWERDLRA